MARKLPGLKRELDARALYSVAYGEIASSIYFALGVVAAHALGFTPLVLLIVGVLFLIVSFSYAEGTAALPETGGAATFVRRASNDLAGFLTGWALFLDYLIVISLSALFLPHYLSGALGISAIDRNPWDIVVAVCVIVVVAAVRLVRRPSLYGVGILVPALDLLTQLMLVVLGLRADAGNASRHASDLGCDRVRPSSGDAGIHGPRDGGKPGRGSATAGRRPAAFGVRGNRDGRHDLRRNRRRRGLRLPGTEDGARYEVDQGAAARSCRSAQGRVAMGLRGGAPGLRRDHRRVDPGCRCHDVHLRLLPTRLLAG